MFGFGHGKGDGTRCVSLLKGDYRTYGVAPRLIARQIGRDESAAQVNASLAFFCVWLIFMICDSFLN